MKLSLAYRLRTILADRNMSQSDLARLCEPLALQRGISISRQDISKYVNGNAFPTDDKIGLLADSLGVPEIWLLGYETADALSQEEIDLCTAWRRCTDKERETIAFILRDYGFTFQRKNTASADIA